MNWFKNLFKNSNNEQPAVALKEEVVEQPTYTNISEPVYSFVETVRKHPGRFMVECVLEPSLYNNNHLWNQYYIEDKKTGESFIYAPWDMGVSNINWLTAEERIYVVKEIEDIYSKRAIKLAELKGKRARQKYIKIYCGE